MSDEPESSWDRLYAADETPWETGTPQPTVVELERAGRIAGDVLDVGCGRGTHASYLATRNHQVTGVDVSTVALKQARAATETDDVTYVCANATELGDLDDSFDTVLDVGLFHALEVTERSAYANELARIVSSAGRVVVHSFGPDAPPSYPPNRIDRDAITTAFTGGEWYLREFRPAPFETANGPVPGTLAILEPY